MNVWNVPQALDAAAKHMAAYYRTYKKQGYGDTTARKLAQSAYNAGPGNVKKYKGVPPFRETRKYVRVIARDEKLFKGF